MKSLNRSLLSYASQRAKGLRSPKSHEVSRPITLNCKLTTGNRTPVTARPFLGSRPIIESSSSSKCSKKLVWDGPRAPRQRSLSRARRGRGRRIFRSVRYSTRGMLDYNRRFGLKISNSDPHIWRSSVLGLGSCNFVHGTPNTEHHHHHHHGHHHSHHGHHHSRFHDHHEGHFSWFFNWKRGGINPYWVCTLTLKAGKIKTNLKPRMVHASSKGKHYSYGISFRNNAKMPHRQHQKFDPKSKTLTPKLETGNNPTNLSGSLNGPLKQSFNRKQVTQDTRPGTEHLKPIQPIEAKTSRPSIGIPKPATGNPKQLRTRPRHFWHSPKKKNADSTPRDPDPIEIKLKQLKLALNLVVPKRVCGSKTDRAAKLKTQNPIQKAQNKTSIFKTQNPATLHRKLTTNTIRQDLGPDTQNPKPEQIQDFRPETSNWQLETHVHFPSSSPLKSPFKVVGAAALPE